MNPGAPERPRRAPKRPRVRTSDHRTCCQNLLRHRLWKAGTVLEKKSFMCFLVLPDEIIDHQIHNVAITKNCQKGPGQPETQSIPGVARFNFASMSWNIYLGWSRLTLKPTIEYNFGQNLQKQGTQQCKKQLFLREIPSALWRRTVDSRLLTMKCPLLSMWRWMEMDLQINSRCLTRYTKPCKAI